MSELTKYIEKPEIDNKFLKILGKEKKQSFVNNLVTIVSENERLSNCYENTIIGAALAAANLNLPISKDIGFAYIVPYGRQAQFQIGYKGLIQLALRTGNYDKLNVGEIFEGELKSFDKITETYDFSGEKVKNAQVIGFFAYFKLKNGFEKMIFWEVEKVRAHGREFSKTFDKSGSPWQKNFNSMGLKTLLKHLLNKWGMLSINDLQTSNLQNAINYDQSVINENSDISYSDNPKNDKKDVNTNEFIENRKEKMNLFLTEFKTKIDNCKAGSEVGFILNNASFEGKSLSDNVKIKQIAKFKISSLENIEDAEIVKTKDF